ncbi:MAG TPA: MOSC N-terminal beta barrel domain-containing protein [Acidimicrobiia bacterium]|nr:MOSC N-terminal beta barrel domain-containing protein [Acidimicrobiia bacterium]
MSELRVLDLWRHPVKSLQGERLDRAVVERDGLAGDRVWGIRDEATGKILTARREPPLLLARSRLDESGRPEITLPDGTICTGVGPRTDETLSAWLKRPVSLVDAAGRPGATAEYFADATDDTSAALEWTMPPGRFVDALPLLVITTASLRAGRALHADGVWDVRRFRPNLLLDADGSDWLEDTWAGRALRIGEVVIGVRVPCTRCTMVTRPQPGLDRDLDIYRALARQHQGTFGVWSDVQTPGTIRAGDTAELAQTRSTE